MGPRVPQKTDALWEKARGGGKVSSSSTDEKTPHRKGKREDSREEGVLSVADEVVDLIGSADSRKGHLVVEDRNGDEAGDWRGGKGSKDQRTEETA